MAEDNLFWYVKHADPSNPDAVQYPFKQIKISRQTKDGADHGHDCTGAKTCTQLEHHSTTTNLGMLPSYAKPTWEKYLGTSSRMVDTVGTDADAFRITKRLKENPTGSNETFTIPSFVQTAKQLDTFLLAVLPADEIEGYERYALLHDPAVGAGADVSKRLATKRRRTTSLPINKKCHDLANDNVSTKDVSYMAYGNGRYLASTENKTPVSSIYEIMKRPVSVEEDAAVEERDEEDIVKELSRRAESVVHVRAKIRVYYRDNIPEGSAEGSVIILQAKRLANMGHETLNVWIAVGLCNSVPPVILYGRPDWKVENVKEMVDIAKQTFFKGESPLPKGTRFFNMSRSMCHTTKIENTKAAVYGMVLANIGVPDQGDDGRWPRKLPMANDVCEGDADSMLNFIQRIRV